MQAYTPIDLKNLKTVLDSFSLAYLYATACDFPESVIPLHSYCVSPNSSLILGQSSVAPDTLSTPIYINVPFPAIYTTAKPKCKGVQVKRKYKPVAMKTKPVASQVSKDFRIKRHILGNPLVTIPSLDPNPPPFILTSCFNNKCKVIFVKEHNTGFLTQAELNVLVNLIAKQDTTFAWEDSEQGSCWPNFFPPVHIPTIPHVLWVQHN